MTAEATVIWTQTRRGPADLMVFPPRWSPTNRELTIDSTGFASPHRLILDNGLVFTARRFRAACRDYRLSQEFITPYTPEQNGMIERFFRSLKEECVWQHNFVGFIEARAAIASWIRWYNERRPHQALGYLSPHQYRSQQLQAVA